MPATCTQVIQAHTHPQVACVAQVSHVAQVVHAYPRPYKSPYPQGYITSYLSQTYHRPLKAQVIEVFRLVPLGSYINLPKRAYVCEIGCGPMYEGCMDSNVVGGVCGVSTASASDEINRYILMVKEADESLDSYSVEIMRLLGILS
jgi:hypothetical protein